MIYLHYLSKQLLYLQSTISNVKESADIITDLISSQNEEIVEYSTK